MTDQISRRVAIGVTGAALGAATIATTGAQAQTAAQPTAGDTLAKVKALAKAKVPGGAIVRVETDADGHAAYEAHMTNADGTPVTVYVDQQFNVVSVESGHPGRPPSSGASA